MHMRRMILWLAMMAGFLLLAIGVFSTIPVSRPNDAPEDFDIQVVLGGNTHQRSVVSHALWLRHRTPILITGDLSLIHHELLRLGVPESYLIHEPTARNTWENASFTKPMLEQRKVASAVIVTSWFHTSRAKACFARQMPGIHFSTSSDVPPPHLSRDMRKVVFIERMKKLHYWATRSLLPWAS